MLHHPRRPVSLIRSLILVLYCTVLFVAIVKTTLKIARAISRSRSIRSGLPLPPVERDATLARNVSHLKITGLR